MDWLINQFIQMLPGMPLPEKFSSRRYFNDSIAPDTVICDLALYLTCDIPGRFFDGQQDTIPIARPACIVMVVGIFVFPQNIAIPIRFQYNACFIEGPVRKAQEMDGFKVLTPFRQSRNGYLAILTRSYASRERHGPNPSVTP